MFNPVLAQIIDSAYNDSIEHAEKAVLYLESAIALATVEPNEANERIVKAMAEKADFEEAMHIMMRYVNQIFE